MRADLSTIQQTLTPEAASVLNLSIAEAARRSHGQTTPLHVAATLLAAPSGYLRQACVRSHPNSSHPLQCRALELCFSVALERLPTTTTSSAQTATDPPISNALMAALKRAQAHQRRGCPEQQQQPLLAVKVELEQLIISILDDPSVSRVMREASFSSPAVKATIEQSINSQQPTSVNLNQSPIGIGFRPNPTPVSFLPNRNLQPNPTPVSFLPNRSLQPNPTPVLANRNLYMNPRLQQGNSAQPGQNRNEEIKKVVDILSRSKKRNPILVGESEPEMVVREVIRRIEKGELGEGVLRNVEVISMEKEIGLDKGEIPSKIKELGGLIEATMGSSSSGGGGGVILDLGDLKWLVERVAPEIGQGAVAAVAELLARFGGEGSSGGGAGRVWLIGTATCETYLRCQVYHPSMESDWDLQAVPVASKSPFPGMFPRLEGNGTRGNSVEPRSPLKNFPTLTTSALPDSARRTSCCPECTESYEQELAKLVAKENEQSSSDGKSEATQPQLPLWLQNAKGINIDTKSADQSQAQDRGTMLKQNSQELHKKWSDTCLHLHPNFHQSLCSERVAPTSLYNPNLVARNPFPPKLQETRNVGETLLLNSNPMAKQPSEQAHTPPTSLYNPKLLARNPFPPKLQETRNLGETLQLNSNPMAKQPLERAHTPPTSLYNPKLLAPNPFPPKLQQARNIGETLQLNSNPMDKQPLEPAQIPPRSPVRTDLVLGQKKPVETTPEMTHKDSVKDFLGSGFLSPEPQQPKFSEFVVEKFANALDADSFKKLLKGLTEKVWWQREAASAVASAVTKCRLGNGKRRGGGSKGDIWLLFTGLDRVGKKKMASVIADQFCGSNPVTICLGQRRDDEEFDVGFRGKTALDRIAEAVRRNPFSVILLEDIDEADLLVRGGIKRAMERGRISDSYGREISLGNVIFILTANWLPENLKKLDGDEKKFASIAGGGWQLRLSVGEKSTKRRAHWLHNTDRPTKKDTGCSLSFDLNLAAENEDDRSYNSSDLTIDHDDDHGLENWRCLITSLPREMVSFIDEAIVFKPVEIASSLCEIKRRIAEKFSAMVDHKFALEVEEAALEKILGGVWLGQTGLDEWTDKVLVPSFQQLEARLPSDQTVVIWLESDSDSDCRSIGDWLPSRITVKVDDGL